MSKKNKLERKKNSKGKKVKCKKCGKYPDSKMIDGAVKFYAQYHWDIGDTSEVWIICQKCGKEIKLVLKCVEHDEGRIGLMILEKDEELDGKDLKLIKE